jgi:hypothetical protein
VIRIIRRETTSARQKNREKIRAALGTVRKEVRTIPREQAREILIAEFRKQGVDPLPSDANVEVFLDYLALANPLKRALFATRALTEAFRPAFSAIREIKAVFGDALVLKGDPDTIDVPVDREAPTIHVSIEQDALDWLNAKFPPHHRPATSSILVLLEPVGDDYLCVAVVRNEQRFGVLNEADSELFRGFIEEGVRDGKPVVIEAIRTVSDDGRWSLDLFRPA